MKLLDLMKYRRSIRKYENRQIPRTDLEKILEAGLYAPNAGGGQRSIICALQDQSLCAQVGKLNVAKFDRKNLAGSYVSADQPSIIDDPSIKSGFYGALTVCVIFGPKNFYTVSRMPSAARKTWCWKRRNWASHPASLPGGKRPLTTRSGRRFCGNGKSRNTTLPAALSCSATVMGSIRPPGPEKITG